jgi:YD repeat-containing protein
MKKLLGMLLVVVLILSTFVSCDGIFNYLNEFVKNEELDEGLNVPRYIPVKAEITSSYGTASVVLDFGENGLLSKQTSFIENEEFETIEFFYNSSNKLTNFVQERNGKVCSTSTYSYGSNGLVSKVTLPDGVAYNYVYDSENRLKEMHFTFNGSTLSSEYYSYDENGLMTEHVTSSKSYSIVKTYSYDSKGRMLRCEYKDEEGYTYTYDSNGNLIQVFGICVPLPPGIGGYCTYDLTYDANGNLEKVTITHTEGDVYVCTFEYIEGTPSFDAEINKFASVAALFSSVTGVLSLSCENPS